jgi:hypothetical protein
MSLLEWRVIPAGVHVAVVEKVDFSFKSVTWLTIVYFVRSGSEEFRIREILALDAPVASAEYARTAEGRGRVKQLLDAYEVPESEVKDFPDISNLLRGKAVKIAISHKEQCGLKIPYVSAVFKRADIPPQNQI